jgi:hypothetical protein
MGCESQLDSVRLLLQRIRVPSERWGVVESYSPVFNKPVRQ